MNFNMNVARGGKPNRFMIAGGAQLYKVGLAGGILAPLALGRNPVQLVLLTVIPRTHRYLNFTFVTLPLSTSLWPHSIQGPDWARGGQSYQP